MPYGFVPTPLNLTAASLTHKSQSWVATAADMPQALGADMPQALGAGMRWVIVGLAASDGIWDHIDADTAVRIVGRCTRGNAATMLLEKALEVI